MAHHHLGLVYRQAGRQDDAIRELKRAIEIDEHSAESLINLGAIYFELGRLDEAIATLKEGAGKMKSAYGVERMNLAIFIIKGKSEYLLDPVAKVLSEVH